MNALLNIENLNVCYRGLREDTDAVRNVSLHLNAGESVAIVGESGCGKTSIALAIMGLLPPKQVDVGGNITFDEHPLLSMSPAALRRLRGRDVAMIFQDPMSSLNPYLRIGVQIAEPLWTHTHRSHRAALQEAERLLDSVGFEDPSHGVRTYPHRLSGGMCQRAMIAGALACAPKLLIADEPTTALDVITQDQVLSLIRAKQREHGMALLLITHDLGIVAQVCDRVAVMYQGQVVETGTTEQIYAAPTHEYTRALLKAVPRLDGPRVRRLCTVSSAVRRPPQPAEKLERETRKAILEVRDLSVHFRSSGRGKAAGMIKAVQHVSFDLREQEVLGLVGQSGSGKSTLIRAMLQLERPLSGEVRLEGRLLEDLSRREKHDIWQQMQLIFQDPYGSLNARMTVARIIAEPLVNYGIVPRRQVRRRVEELMTMVHLDPTWQTRYPHEFSGGQRQRIGIARALACNPRILFCDEPVSALDVSIQADVLNLLCDLKEQLNLTLLFVSHDLAVVRHVADRVAVMHRGEIVEWLDSDRIVESASHPYTRLLLQAVPIPDPARYRKPNATPRMGGSESSSLLPSREGLGVGSPESESPGTTHTYFFCGVGGSGMSALAQLLCRRGCRVLGSDRSFDQGKNAGVADGLRRQGVQLVPQDGSGVTDDVSVLVVSTAIESSIPDVAAATARQIRIMTRSELLADVFHSYRDRIAVGGTSGKSTVTAMLAHILTTVGRNPTVINGAAMSLAIADPGIGNVRSGSETLCVIEADESDGSIANYAPTISVLTNMGLDHKSLPELQQLFGDFIAKAGRGAVFNLDCPECARLPQPERVVSFSLRDDTANLYACDIRATESGMTYRLKEGTYPLPVQGEHNVANALAAIAAALVLGIAPGQAAGALASFGGVRRRLELIGIADGVRVVDDFAHNPDKVAASLSALKLQQGRLRIYFQPHGFAPLRLFLDELAEAFAAGLGTDDLLVISPVYYAGGTASRELTSEDLVAAVSRRGARAEFAGDRDQALKMLCSKTTPGDRIVVMGARDDTLSSFCHRILTRIRDAGVPPKEGLR